MYWLPTYFFHTLHLLIVLISMNLNSSNKPDKYRRKREQTFTMPVIVPCKCQCVLFYTNPNTLSQKIVNRSISTGINLKCSSKLIMLWLSCFNNDGFNDSLSSSRCEMECNRFFQFTNSGWYFCYQCWYVNECFLF